MHDGRRDDDGSREPPVGEGAFGAREPLPVGEDWPEFRLPEFELPEPDLPDLGPELPEPETAAPPDVSAPETGGPAAAGAGAGPPPDPGGRALRVALALLASATLVAAVLVAIRVAPPIARGLGRAAAAAGDLAGDGAAGVDDAWSRWSGRLEAIAADATAIDAAVVDAPEGSTSVLVVVVDAGGRGVAYALVARGPDGSSTVMLAPPGLRGILPGFGDFPLADAPLFESSDLAAVTITNQLGVRIDGVLTLGPGELSGALVDPVEIDLPVPLIVGEGDEGRVLAKSGRAERAPAVVETVVTTRGLSDELEWLQRQGAAWDGILTAVAADPEIGERLAAHADATGIDITGLLAVVGADSDRNITAVPVTRVAVGGPDAGYALNAEAAEPFVAQRLGHLLLREGTRPRVEVLNGNGRVGTTRVVAGQLVRRGYRVVRTDNADAFDYEQTQVVAHGRVNRAEGERVLRLVGTGELLLELRNPSGVVDISIIVGRDVPAGEG